MSPSLDGYNGPFQRPLGVATAYCLLSQGLRDKIDDKTAAGHLYSREDSRLVPDAFQ